jgi:hypothetical protein
MNSKSKSLRAFVSSCEPQKEEATPALVPKLRFPEFRGKSHTKARSHEEGEGRP